MNHLHLHAAIDRCRPLRAPGMPHSIQSTPNQNRRRPEIRRIGVAAIAVSAALVATACGGSDTPTGGKAQQTKHGAPAKAKSVVAGAALEKLDACTLLSPTDVQAALGVAPAGQPRSRTLGANHACFFTLPQDSNFVLQVNVFRDADDAGQGYGAIASTTAKGGTPVSGVGEKAIFKTGHIFGADFANLDVLVGRSEVSLHHDSTGATASQAQLTQLASKDLAQLKESNR